MRCVYRHGMPKWPIYQGVKNVALPYANYYYPIPTCCCWTNPPTIWMQKAWLGWNRDKTYQRINTAAAGWVHAWCEVKEVLNDLVSFQWTYVFESDNKIMTSNSTLRFRDLGTIEKSLLESGFSVIEIRDAPDRPGNEFVFIAKPT